MKTDEFALKKLSKVLQDFVEGRASSMIQDAQNLPILMSYSSDGTPIRTTMRVTSKHGTDVKTKVGKSTKEYLCQVAFYRTIDATGEASTTAVMRGPLPLTHGKSCESIFAAGRSFCQTLREQGHMGIAVQHYAFDRAGYAKLVRMFQQLHMELAPTFGLHSPAGTTQMLDLTEWVIGTPCGLHDGHNALKWSMHAYFNDPQLLKDIYIIFRSLRESFDLICQHLCPWLVRVVKFVDPEDLPSPDVLKATWTSLNIDPVLVETLVDLGICWDGEADQLKVDKKWRANPDFIETLSGAVLSLWEFRPFSESRWITVGLSCRTMVASLLSGLKSLVSYIRNDTKSSDFHIHGFGRLDKPDACQFLVLASMASYVPDGALQSLMEDGRLALRVNDVRAAMYEELDWLQGIRMEVWDRLAHVCNITGFLLRSKALSCGFKAAAFFHFRVLEKVMKLPWTLAMGDKEENLRKLVADDAPKPTEPIALKIYSLLKLGYSKMKICMALDLLLNCNWHTMCTEQTHAQAAVVKKFHAEMGEEMVIARSMISAFQKMLPSLTAEQKQELKLLKELKESSKKQSNRITGRHAYFTELVQLSNQWLKEARMEMPKHMSQVIMKSYSKRFANLTQEQKNQLEHKAQMKRLQSSEELVEERTYKKARLDLLQARMEEAADLAPPINFNACKVSNQDESALDELWNRPKYTKVYIAAQAKDAMIAPDPLDNVHIPHLKKHAIYAEPVASPKPSWLGLMCQCRDVLQDTALNIVTDTASFWYKFMFAMISPQYVSWTPLQLCTEIHDAAGSSSGGSAGAASTQHQFSIMPDSFVAWQDLPLTPGCHLYVLPDVLFCGDYLLVSQGSSTELMDFLNDNKPLKPAPGKADDDDSEACVPAPKKVKPLSPALLAKYPWLAKKMPSEKVLLPIDYDEEEDPEPSSQSQSQSGQSDWLDLPLLKKDLSDEQVEDLFEELEKKRTEWATDPKRYSTEYFKMSFLGGKWLIAHKGKAWDAVQAAASGNVVKDWCKKYHLQQRARFEADLYGEDGCMIFAKAYIEKMQYFFVLWRSQPNEDYVFTNEDLAGWRESDDFIAEANLWTARAAKTRLTRFRNMSPHL